MITKSSKPMVRVRTIGYDKAELAPQHSFLLAGLRDKYQFIHDLKNPDLVIIFNSSGRVFSYKMLRKLRTELGFKPFIICVTGEINIKENKTADYTFSYRPDSYNNTFLVAFIDTPFGNSYFPALLSGKPNKEMQLLRQTSKDRFCCFIYTNIQRRLPDTIVRKKFCQQLMKYKKVDCPGRVLNNMHEKKIGNYYEHSYFDKLKFISRYKFKIVFENRVHPGYITEKTYDSFLAGSIPIYKGAPNIADFFNPDAFINCADYNSFEEVIERVKQIDNDPELYKKYILAPPILPNSLLHNNNSDNLTTKMDMLIQKTLQRQNTYAQETPSSYVEFIKLLKWRIKNFDREITTLIPRS